MGQMSIDLTWQPRPCGKGWWLDYKDPAFACPVCQAEGCCDVFNRCAEVLGEWTNRPPGAACGPQMDCSAACVRERLDLGSEFSDQLVAECVHGCPGDYIPSDEWPAYEPAVLELVQCFLSAPAYVRTASDRRPFWEQVDHEDAGDGAPGGCFYSCPIGGTPWDDAGAE